MSLAQFLSQLGGAIGGQQMGNQMMPGMPGMIGGFGGGTFNVDGSQATPVQPSAPMQALTGMEQIQTPPDFMQQVAQSQQMPMQQPQMQEAPRSPTSRFTGIRDTLGQIGDYLLQANDMAPIYGPRKAEHQRREASAALSQYLGQIDPTIGGIAQYDPQSAIELLKLKSRQQGQDPTALMQNMEYLRRLNPGMTDAQLAEVAQYAIAAPRMYGSPETGFTPDPNYPFARSGAQPEGGDLQDGATATNPQTGEKIQYRNGAWIPMGGASGNAGGGFP